jgi:hypothetical protein
MYHRLSYVSISIFGKLDIIYHRLSYVFEGVLPFKSLVLYIYWPRGTMDQSINNSTNSILLHFTRNSHLISK